MQCSATRARLCVAQGVICAIFAVCGAVLAADGPAIKLPTDERAQAELDAKISGLIAQLGADQFATREKAQSELERMGLAAFDALYEAQNHGDIEIALRARYLVSSLSVNWAQDDDPAEVKRILRGYGAENEDVRKSRMDQLAKIEDGKGVSALCRLVRFETSNRLSKQGALLIMNRKELPTKEARDELGRLITSSVGLSKRAGAQWLKAYVQTLADPAASLPLWERLAKAEHDTFAQSAEQHTSREIARDMLRWQSELLRRLERESDAQAVMRRSLDLVENDRVQVMDACDWLMERKAWPVIDELAKRFGPLFDENSVLLYRLGEAQLKQGKTAEGEVTAEKAYKLLPEDADPHIVAAFSLQERGLVAWAEREYRHVMKIGPTGALHDLRARFLLAEMLHDNLKELDAAQVLQGAVSAMEKDPTVLQAVERLGRDPGGIRSRMHFFYSQHAAEQKDEKKALEQLALGAKADPTDADVLIAMYRAPGADEAWRTNTKKLIASAAEHFRTQVRDYTVQARAAGTEPQREYVNRQLASACNQLAWLVSNTEGDFDEALRCSQQSLELRPETGGYLDTLGRCYYAKEDFANAVKYQTRAVELEPHTVQIRRQLELFKAALGEAPKKEGK
jgi:tetratricopeptide (TPR) repeat protein